MEVNFSQFDELSINYEEEILFSDRPMELLTMEDSNRAFAPQVTSKNDIDLTPISTIVCKKIQGVESKRVLKVLFDSGASHTLIRKQVLPPRCIPQRLDPRQGLSSTVAGTFRCLEKVKLQKIFLPELDYKKQIHGTTAHVFDAPCAYDVIMGRDMLRAIGMDLNFSDNTVRWLEREIKMRSRKEPMDMSTLDESDPYDEETNANDVYILDAEYKPTTARAVADKQTHLSKEQRNQLERILAKYNWVFDGRLGHYPHRKIHLELINGSHPVHSRPYSVPMVHAAAFKKELLHLI